MTQTIRRTQPAPSATRPSPTPGRVLQLVLAGFWLFDGILKLQAWMFTPKLTTTMLTPSAGAMPQQVAGSVTWMASLVAQFPAAADATFALIELAIAVGIAWRPLVRPALLVSVGWALLVSWFAESFGGLLTWQADPVSGDPGVLLYALLAVVLLPGRPGPDAPPRALRPGAARVVWVVLWGLLAALMVRPGALADGALDAGIAGTGDGQPVWVTASVDAASAVTARFSPEITVALAVALALVALSALLSRRARRAGVVLGAAIGVVFWLFGQAAGDLVGGMTTDPNTGLVLACIALAYWPRASDSTEREVRA